MDRISGKLTKRLDGIRAYPVGVSAEDIGKLKLTPGLMADIFECLESSEMEDKQMALFFSEVLIASGKLADADEDKLISLLMEISRGEAKQIRPSSYKLLRRFRSKVTNYRNLMLEGLKDSDPMVRKEALLGYETYCRSREVTPLERFENDEYLAEISMNGALLYELRNLALETIEYVIGKTFKKTERTEIVSDGEVAFCWDWTPYHKWKNNWLNRLREK